MKALFLGLLLLSANAAAGYDGYYPASGRYSITVIDSTGIQIVRDTFTGCEYLGKEGENSSFTLVVGSCKIAEPKQ